MEEQHLNESLHLRRDRATSFGSVAEIYDRIRPTYPDALVRELLTGDPADVVDVGCGTGRAAVLLAAQGCSVLGVEPDPGMAQVARGHGIDVEIATFEDWDAGDRRFDLLISGQAWHWVEPVAGAAKAIGLLRPGGRIALFWNMDSMDVQDRGALDAAYDREAPELRSNRRKYGGKQDRREDVQDGLRHAGFLDVTVSTYGWQRSYSADEYADLLHTFSDHNLLPAEQRERLFAAVREVVAELGELVVTYDCQLVSGVVPGAGTLS